MAGDNKKYSFIEPLGHDFPQSKLERYWNSFWGPYSLSRERTRAYASNSNMTFLPMKYSLEHFEIESCMPNDQWIIESCIALVRDEFSDRTQQISSSWPVKISNIISVNEEFLHTFSKISDKRIHLADIMPKSDSDEEIAISIYNILCNEHVGDKKNRINNSKDDFVKYLLPMIKNKSRLLFVIPGFPFKDQNRFRVPFESEYPDMAEIAFMIRLYTLTQAIYQVHPFGADVVVLTDGDLYNELFGIEKGQLEKYHKRLIEYRNKLNLQATVSFVSIKEMIDRCSETDIGWKTIEYIKERLNVILCEQQNSQFLYSFSILKQGMKWNYNSKVKNLCVDDAICWKILCSSKDSIECEFQNIWEDFDLKAKNIAIEYVAVNLMLKRTSLIQKFFPESIRCTVHPKPNQFALAGNSLYAWNGVAWSKSWPNDIEDIRVQPYMDLAVNETINQVVLENSNAPLFYTSSHLDKDVAAAKRAFPLQQYKISNMLIKPLKNSDVELLFELGKNDNNFSWERIPQDFDYYKKLIDFRIKHYNEHGFGVYGIWNEDTLVGQVGLQVVSDEIDQVEWVMFLGKDFVGNNIGSSILNHIINLCKQNGMTALYAIVRQENDAGIAITKKFGGVPINKVVHYLEKGMKFKIDLTRVV